MSFQHDEDLVVQVSRILVHREHFQREQWIEKQGWKVKQGKVLVDGYEDPETFEVLDLETAFTVAQTRDVMRILKEQEDKRCIDMEGLS